MGKENENERETLEINMTILNPKPRKLVAEGPQTAESENDAVTEDEEIESSTVTSLAADETSVDDIENMAPPSRPRQLMDMEVGHSNQETIEIACKENRMKKIPVK